MDRPTPVIEALERGEPLTAAGGQSLLEYVRALEDQLLPEGVTQEALAGDPTPGYPTVQEWRQRYEAMPKAVKAALWTKALTLCPHCGLRGAGCSQAVIAYEATRDLAEPRSTPEVEAQRIEVIKRTLLDVFVAPFSARLPHALYAVAHGRPVP